MYFESQDRKSRLIGPHKGVTLLRLYTRTSARVAGQCAIPSGQDLPNCHHGSYQTVWISFAKEVLSHRRCSRLPTWFLASAALVCYVPWATLLQLYKSIDVRFCYYSAYALLRGNVSNEVSFATIAQTIFYEVSGDVSDEAGFSTIA
jgi:hypothetical protein